jgi:hypothetical protein
VLVLAARGDHEVHVELADGRRCYLPLIWTERQPRREAEVVRGEPVRLTVAGLRPLAAFIAARKIGCKKLDLANRDAEKRHDAPVERPTAAVTVVGQACASGVERADGGRMRREGL